MREIAYKHALRNAVEHGGAEEKAVLGKVLAELPELRKKVPEVLPVVREVVAEVNRLSPGEREEGLKRFTFVEQRKEERRGLLELQNAGQVVLRFAPNPSGPLHLGHCRAAILNDEYARRYNGKLILRLEDTDPARVDPRAYEMIEEDLAWLGVAIHETIVQSERLDIYYEHARRLVEMGRAYVCTCPSEEFQRLRVAKRACPCRALTMEENLGRYEKMFADYRPGEAALRLMTSLDLPDPSMRDFPILRITDEPHPRVKGRRVYPLMNFSVAVDDHLLGLTHVLRGKDHIANTQKQGCVYDYFGWQRPLFIHYGLMKIEGLELSTSGMARGIKDGLYEGWDDARLGTLRAMRRRGIQPGAIRKVMIDVGTKESDISFSWKNLYAYNKEFVEPMANRYFFVQEPQELLVEGCRGMEVHAPLHPDHRERGERRLSIKARDSHCIVHVSKQDLEALRVGDVVRLMEAFNIELLEKGPSAKAKVHSQGLEEARKLRARLIHWVPEDHVKVRVVGPDGVSEGYGEEGLREVAQDSVIQFERFGFVVVDSKGEELVVYFAHR